MDNKRNTIPVKQYFELEAKVINDYKRGISVEQLMDKYETKEFVISLMIENYEHNNITETVIILNKPSKW